MDLNNENISIEHPGPICKLPDSIMNDLKKLSPKFNDKLKFFGGHPVSITKQSCNTIFSVLREENQVQSPYLVCEKTDGIRYILVICRVYHIEDENQKKNQCYLISRQGSRSLVSYAVNMQINTEWENFDSQFKNVIQILDGQLCVDTNTQKKSVLRFLAFDVLVHLGKNVTEQPLRNRLNLATKFLRCNDYMLQMNPILGGIQIKLKDFFRLTCKKYTVTQFLLQKYIKCLPHKNDGLVFNLDNAPYIFGTNDGYIKWKPAHLNTLDFLIVPNTNIMIQGMLNRVLDLYVGMQSDQYSYIKIFYSFTIVNEDEFHHIQQRYRKKLQQAFQKQQNNCNQDHQDQYTSQFTGALIVQCKFQNTNAEQRDIFKQLLSIHHRTPQQIRQDIMKPNHEQKELEVIHDLQKNIYDKCWKIYSYRSDKSLPNNIQIAHKIQQSIKDNITQEQMIHKNEQLLKKAKNYYQSKWLTNLII